MAHGSALGHTGPVRRTLAGLLFGLAYACASITVAGFLLQRTAFDPDRAGHAAEAVLGDSAIRAAVVDLIATDAVAQLAGDDPAVENTLRSNLELVASVPEGQALLADVIRDAHARLIGERTTPVTISGAQLVPIVRDERAGQLPAVTLPVPTITALDVARTTLRWMLPITAVATVILVALGLAAHPVRADLLRSLSMGLLLLAVLAALLGYVIPRLLLPVLDTSPWANVPARLADDSLPLLAGLELVLVGGAAAMWALAGASRRRGWHDTIDTSRWAEERRWLR